MLLQSLELLREFLVASILSVLTTSRWWHQWTADMFDQLAGSLIIGHLLECASYVSGGFSSDFKDVLKAGKHIDMGFPICAVDHNGHGVMGLEKNKGGVMTVNSVTSQLLYEIQGPQYYNCDVTAQIENIKIEQVGENLVKVSGVRGLPPPPTTKVA
jgi:Acyclic terpene utilisation family protein AtuA